MYRRNFGWACGLAVLLLQGCANVRGPQFCNWGRRDVVTEGRLYEFHDPLPDESAGPDTQTRPLPFIKPRTDTRRDFDLRMLLSMSRGPGASVAASRPFPARPLVSPIAPAVPISPAVVQPGIAAEAIQPY